MKNTSYGWTAGLAGLFLLAGCSSDPGAIGGAEAEGQSAEALTCAPPSFVGCTSPTRCVCESPYCTSGATVCSQNQDSMATCVNGKWQSQPCSFGCEGSRCFVPACADGALTCSGTTKEQCVGGAWQATTTTCQSKVVVGDYSSYLLTGGTVTAWGLGADGELGNGATANSAVPVQVSGLTNNVVDIAAGGSNACAILVDGTVACWGSRNLGMLGDDKNLSPEATQVVPAPIPNLTNVTGIAVGGHHACALASGTVWCWGDNQLGQSGGATAFNAPVPVLSGATQVAVGDSYSCALLASGAVQCWGDDSEGALGNGQLAGTYASPVTSTGITASQIVAGRYTSCALQKGATTYECWGDNNEGEAGLNDGVAHVSLPTAAPLLTGMTGMAVSVDHSCAILNGGVQCWGNNASGYLGNGTVVASSIPVPVSTLTSGVTSVAVGWHHACALANGSVWCWGESVDNELGSASTSNAYYATPQHI